MLSWFPDLLLDLFVLNFLLLFLSSICYHLVLCKQRLVRVHDIYFLPTSHQHLFIPISHLPLLLFGFSVSEFGYDAGYGVISFACVVSR